MSQEYEAVLTVFEQLKLLNYTKNGSIGLKGLRVNTSNNLTELNLNEISTRLGGADLK